MANSRLRGSRNRILCIFAFALGLLNFLASPAAAQQHPEGFAVERFYPSAPGGGWFVMDDLNISGGLGGAIELTSGYARNPLEVTSPDRSQKVLLVSGEAFVELGAAVTYDRYRLYLNLPMPFLVTGNSGTIGLFQLTAPNVTAGTNPDTVADPRVGFDVRLLGKPGGRLRLGVGTQLIFPAGSRADYVSDARYRAMLRLLAAGDSGAFSYAGQLGVHIRPLNDFPAPGSPNGSEFLFGGSIGRKFPLRPNWNIVVGPEIYGETAFHSFFNSEQTGAEGLITTRLERTGSASNLRFKVGFGHDLVPHFGAPQWRVLVGVEVFAQRAGNHN